ncbi:11831_t:CDS:1, partial [Cetraspora pellucida]
NENGLRARDICSEIPTKLRLTCWRQMFKKFKNMAHVLETDVQRIQKYGLCAGDRCPEITEEE